MIEIGLIALAVLLFLLPLAVLADVLTLRRRWRAVPLHQRNMTRATFAAFALVICGVLAVSGFPWQGTAGIAAIALVYLGVGLHGSQGSRFDVMRAFWWAVAALGCASVLAFFLIKGSPL